MGRSSLFFSSQDTGYDIPYSCIFNGSNEYMQRTPSAGDRRKWTMAGWFKRETDSVQHNLFAGYTGAANLGQLYYDTDNKLKWYDYTSGFNWNLITTATYTGSAWRHICATYDTAQGTASDRCTLAVDGVDVTSFSTETYPSASFQGYVNNSIVHRHGSYSGAHAFFNGKMAEIHFLDSIAATASSFISGGEPIEYAGSHGTNGYHLDNANSSSLGEDAAGSNDYTTVNMDSGNQSTDTPTS